MKPFIFSLALVLAGCDMANELQVIGVKDASGVCNGFTSAGAQVAITVDDLDTTIYPDRAVFRWLNASGSDATVSTASIRGKPVIRQFGRAGYKVDDIIDYDSIRKDGPESLEIENEYLIDPSQIINVADWKWKYNRDKHTYSCMFVGCHYWFEPGEWYQLTLSHSVPSGATPTEDIDSVVQVESVETDIEAGGVGETMVSFREVEENWIKTLVNTTNIALSGSGQNKPQRNVVVVGASTYTGFADYLCDGVDDEVEIQAAIDYVSNAFGGGTVQLTEGIYKLSAAIIVKNNILLDGAGDGTVIYVATPSAIVGGSNVCTISNMLITQAPGASALASDGAIINCAFGKIINVTASYISFAGANVTLSYIFVAKQMFSCAAKDISMKSNNAIGIVQLAIYEGTCVSCIAESISFERQSSGYGLRGYVFTGGSYFVGHSGNSVTGCISSDISLTDSGSGGYDANVYVYMRLDRVSNSTATNVYSNTASTLIAGFATCYYLSNCSAYDIVPTGAPGNAMGFYNCRNLVVCNVDVSGYGFHSCNSVQQCRALNCTTAAYYVSYADSGTANACADTAAGGYNS